MTDVAAGARDADGGVTVDRRLLALILAPLLAVAMSTSPAHASVVEARLNFQVLPNGPAPGAFGPGPAMLTVNPPDNSPTELRIVGGKLTNDSTVPGRAAGYYTSASLGAPITGIGARWTFTRRGGTPGAMAMLISQSALRPPFPLHLVITPNRWIFGVWPPDGPVPGTLQTLQEQYFPVPLKEDGAEVYEVRVEINGARADIDLPDGQHQIVIDPRIAEWAGPFATFEAYSDNGVTDSRVGFTEIWAQSLQVQ
ncbi:hypothetical protein [Mycobacterium scrofulaceum]|nr:hypothetical protein [Mycobacterium scrofulaceum]